MRHRIMDVTAKTTLAHAPASVHGLDWVDDATAVVDVGAAEDPPAVRLDLELDPTDLDHVDPHAETVRLTPTQARSLADALTEAADRIPEA